MHKSSMQILSRLSGMRIPGFPPGGPRASVGRRWELHVRGLVSLLNSWAGPKLSGEVIHKAPLVREPPWLC